MSPARSLQFQHACTWSLSGSPVPPRAFVLYSPLGLSIMPSARGKFLHLRPLLAGWPGCLVPSVVEGWHSWGSDFTLFNELRAVGGPPENKSGFGYSGPSLPSWLSLSSAKLLYREDFPVWIHGVDMALVQFRVVSLRADGKKVLRSETQQDVSWRKTTFTLCTHTRMVSFHAQVHTAFAGNTHYPSGHKSPLRGSNSPLSSTCPGTTAPSFPRFLIFPFDNI